MTQSIIEQTEAILTAHFSLTLRQAEKRARGYSAEISPITGQELAKKVIAQQIKCAYCDNRFKWNEMTLDHVIPLSSGYREHSVRNLVICCKPCNSSKRDKPVFDWLRECDRSIPDWLDKLSSQDWFDIAYPESEYYHPMYGDSRLSELIYSIPFLTLDQRRQLLAKINTKKLARQKRIELLKMFEQFKAFTAV